jgi:hypothetical protein
MGSHSTSTLSSGTLGSRLTLSTSTTRTDPPQAAQVEGSSKGRGKGEGKGQREEVEPWAVQDLTRLLALENAEWIGIEIQGGGALAVAYTAQSNSSVSAFS